MTLMVPSLAVGMGASSKTTVPVLINGQLRCAIVLHGLGRTSYSMNKVARSLRSKRFLVINESYPSTKYSLNELSDVVPGKMDKCRARGATALYFVTHSLGAILVRQHFQDHFEPDVNAVVMLAPPNHGSPVVDAFRERWWFKWFTGLPGQEMGTGPDDFPPRLKPMGLPLGIIAGDRSSDPWFSYLFDEPNDGKLTVESTKLPEMWDHLVVDEGHTFMMNSNEVIHQILYFFDNLKFER